MVNIFSVGTPTIDNIIPVEPNPQIRELLSSLNVIPGCKTRIGEDTAGLLSGVMSDCTGVVTAPGGSAANTLRAMQQLLGDDFSATLFTMLGTGAKSQILREALMASGISLKPGLSGANLAIQSDLAPSESFVFVFPNGQRGILNYPGTIKDHIQKVPLQKRDIINTDVVMLFGSVRETYGSEIFDEILKTRWDANRPLWFSLPTNHSFVRENKDYFESLLPSINVLVGNSEELGALLGKISETVTQAQQQEVSERLKLSNRVLSSRANETGNNISPNPICFITEGQDGAQVLSGEHGSVKLRASQAQHCVNTLGAGDVTTGVFYAGISVGMIPAAAATLAMTAGAITVENIAAVPDNLAEELAQRDPVNWNVFQSLKQVSRVRGSRLGGGRY